MTVENWTDEKLAEVLEAFAEEQPAATTGDAMLEAARRLRSRGRLLTKGERNRLLADASSDVEANDVRVDPACVLDALTRYETLVAALEARLLTQEKDSQRLDWLNADAQRLEEIFGATVRNEQSGDIRAIIDAAQLEEASADE